MTATPRTHTPDQITYGEDGVSVTRTVKIKRHCNGCGTALGDVDNRDVDNHGNLTDVRAECQHCAPLVELETAGCKTWQLTPRNIGQIDDLVDHDGHYAKGYFESVDGKTTCVGLRIGSGPDRIAAAIADALKPRYGGPQHNTPGGLPLTATAEEIRLHRAQPLADAVLSVLPANQTTDRATILRAEAEHLIRDLYPAVYEDAGYKTALGVNRAAMELLDRAAAAELQAEVHGASGPHDTDDTTEQAETQAPADPWSVRYHQMGRAELNPAVCICGLGVDAIVHNEPPHPFNSRLKAAHHAAVAGICTDCHHHKTAACHTDAAP